MKILVVGGGSGGHVTPVVAVLKEIKQRHPRAKIKFWVDSKFEPQAKKIIDSYDSSIPVQTVIAGKLRRYHHLNFWQHLLWPSLVSKNLADVFKVLAGIIQSFWRLLWWRPDVVFTKGGFVCLPVGVAAATLQIPLVIHDSDAHPGLTNRILARWATVIATGAPLEYYTYPKSKAHYVGIPIGESFKPFSKEQQQAAKKGQGLTTTKPLIVVTGGGLGAKRLNAVVLEVLPKLQQLASVVLICGEAHYQQLRAVIKDDTPDFQLHSFVTNMQPLLGAADVVVARAGATTILELAALHKPTILVPNAALSGGHQLKNAAVYGDAQAAIVVDEDAMVENPDILLRAVKAYFNDPKMTAAMADRFGKFAKPNAAADMADLILATAKRGR